jgi:apolipoprotein N-acyltransferase
VIDAYADEIAKLHGSHVQLIVLPENIARVAPEWVTEAQDKLAKAAPEGATVVAGFNTFVDGAQRNVSWALSPTAHAPVTYEKRRLVPALESTVFTPGPGPRALSNGIGLEICKDMDFHAMIRSDEVATKPELLAVPAWDFKEDDWSHARVAILRSVENGVPMARTHATDCFCSTTATGASWRRHVRSEDLRRSLVTCRSMGMAGRRFMTVPTTPSAGSVWW